MTIEILYFNGCPNHDSALERLRQAAKRLGIDPEMRMVLVDTPEAALEHRFVGSPTIRVNGTDIDPAVREQTSYGLTCRRYPGDGAFAPPPGPPP